MGIVGAALEGTFDFVSFWYFSLGAIKKKKFTTHVTGLNF